MKLIVVGKNSSIYSMVKSRLLCFDKIIQLNRKKVLGFDLEPYDSDNCTFVIFSGIVSNDATSLEQIEKFHLSLVKKLENLKRSKVILISSSAVYGDYKKCFSETDTCLPSTTYGHSKLVIENMYLKAVSSKLSILRLGNVVGLDTIGKIFQNLDENLRYLDCRNDLSTPLRTYVDDRILSEALLGCINFQENLPILNVGRSKPQSMHEITNEIGLRCTLRKTNKSLNDIILNTSFLHRKVLTRAN